MSDAFNKAAEEVKNLSKSPNNDELIELYGLYKQATVGDVNTERPGMLDMKGKAKWDGWKNQEGRSKEQAEALYIELATSLKEKYDFN
eukprot:Awhi_evm1s13657